MVHSQLHVCTTRIPRSAATPCGSKAQSYMKLNAYSTWSAPACRYPKTTALPLGRHTKSRTFERILLRAKTFDMYSGPAAELRVYPRDRWKRDQSCKRFTCCACRSGVIWLNTASADRRFERRRQGEPGKDKRAGPGQHYAAHDWHDGVYVNL